MPTKKPDYFTVKTTFLAATNGSLVEFHKGEIVDADDPVLQNKDWRGYFEPLVVREHLNSGKAVEQATAAPGEKRGK